MREFINKLVAVAVISLFVGQASAISFINFGGEIPWPLSIQHTISASNSKGLWEVKHQNVSKLLNVEISEDSISGFDWIRISELKPQTFEVLAWGEGFFSPKKVNNGPQSSFSQVTIGTDLAAQDQHGRYITMYPNGEDSKKAPYIIRVVEVETPYGNVLGVTVIGHLNQRYDHMLGRRLFEDPLSCVETQKSVDKLNCYLGLDNSTSLEE